MEININCDLGEKSKLHSNHTDPKLLDIINSANIACGFHAGDDQSMNQVIEISKKNWVSIGAHPSFNDQENFGRKRMNLPSSEIRKLIIDQYAILQNIASTHGENVTHIKPHGALNNMACEDFDLSITIGTAIKEFDQNLIFMILPLTKMQKAAQKLNIKYACEIFADRNYDDNGLLISRNNYNALINDPNIALKKVLKMLKNKSIYSYSGKKLPCEIDSICVHGDGKYSVEIAKTLKLKLSEKGYILKKLNLLKKYM